VVQAALGKRAATVVLDRRVDLPPKVVAQVSPVSLSGSLGVHQDRVRAATAAQEAPAARGDRAAQEAPAARGDRAAQEGQLR